MHYLISSMDTDREGVKVNAKVTFKAKLSIFSKQLLAKLNK